MEPVTIIAKRKRTPSGNRDPSIHKSSDQRTKRTKHSSPIQLHTPESFIPETCTVALSPPCPTLYSPIGSEITTVSTPTIHESYESLHHQSNSSRLPHAYQNTSPHPTGDSVLKLLSGTKLGSTRDTAAFYLTSFLAHIETLGKLPSSPLHAILSKNCWS